MDTLPVESQRVPSRSKIILSNLFFNKLPSVCMAAKIGEIPEITECYNITGNNCVIMKVSTPTTKRLEVIIGQLQAIGETNTSIILSPTFEQRIIRRN